MNERKRLLIATGDEAVRAWFKDFFARYKDLEGDLLSESHDAIERITARKPDVVLLDIPSTGSFDTGIFQEIRTIGPYLPIITLTEAGDAKERLRSLEGGAYSSIVKPLSDSGEIYCTVSNAIAAYRERRESALAVSEMKDRCEADRLNLLELELVKGLQHMIGETEEPASIFKHSFSLIKNYLAFEAFAALVPRHEEAEIYVYPNVALNEDIGETITGALIKRMARLAEEDKKVKVVIQEKTASRSPSDETQIHHSPSGDGQQDIRLLGYLPGHVLRLQGRIGVQEVLRAYGDRPRKDKPLRGDKVPVGERRTYGSAQSPVHRLKTGSGSAEVGTVRLSALRDHFRRR